MAQSLGAGGARRMAGGGEARAAARDAGGGGGWSGRGRSSSRRHTRVRRVEGGPAGGDADETRLRVGELVAVGFFFRRGDFLLFPRFLP